MTSEVPVIVLMTKQQEEGGGLAVNPVELSILLVPWVARETLGRTRAGVKHSVVMIVRL